MSIMLHFLLSLAHREFAGKALMYNGIVFMIFLAVYMMLNFNKHFTSQEPVTTKGKVYYAVMTHSAVGSNDISPRTDTARIVTLIHVTLAWIQPFLLFLVAASWASSAPQA